MKRLIVVLMLTAVGKCGALLLNDGQHHVIDYVLINDGIELQENFWHEQTTVVITPTGTVDECKLRDSSIATIDGHVVRAVSVHDSAVFVLQEGSIGYGIYANQHSRLYLNNGSVAQNITVQGDSQLDMFGGSATGRIDIRDNGQAAVSGGSVAQYNIRGNGVVTVYGRDFVIDGQQVGYGEFTRGDDLFVDGSLSGVLGSGESLDVSFEIYDNAKMVLVPEPTTLLLLGLGGLMLRRKR